MTGRGRPLATFIVTSVALFMSSLDNLVVTMALPAIKSHLHASLSSLEWTVNAYTLTFAVLLLPGATLGDRFGRKKIFMIGLSIFTTASALAALSSTANELVAARALQGVGGAILTPLTLTLLSVAVPPSRRGLALGAWGAIAGLAIAVGPVVGGAIVEGASWSWIFWLNVPIGIVLLPVAVAAAEGESRSGRTTRRRRYGSCDGRLVLGGARSGEGERLGLGEQLDHRPVRRGRRRSSPRSSAGRRASPTRCCPCGCSATAGSPRATSHRCSCSSGCSARSSCSRSSSRSPTTTRRCLPASARCPGPRCRSSSRRSPDCCPTASVDAGSSRPVCSSRPSDCYWLASVATPTVPYSHMVPGLAHQRIRHGAVLRPGREPGAVVGAPRRAGHRVGCAQRDPRAWAACSASPFSRRCSRTPAATRVRKLSRTAWCRRSSWVP